jgi:hypothetical protein
MLREIMGAGQREISPTYSTYQFQLCGLHGSKAVRARMQRCGPHQKFTACHCWVWYLQRTPCQTCALRCRIDLNVTHRVPQRPISRRQECRSLVRDHHDYACGTKSIECGVQCLVNWLTRSTEKNPGLGRQQSVPPGPPRLGRPENRPSSGAHRSLHDNTPSPPGCLPHTARERQLRAIRRRR